MEAETHDPDPMDGRRLRREQGRLAVIDATIDLVLEGNGPPSVEQVADRAGVSQASIFRYFATLDELRGHGIRRYFERYDHLLAIPDIGEHSLTRRVDNLVQARVAYHRSTEPISRLARRQAYDIPELSETLARVRATLADQLGHHFEPELARLRPGPRQERVAVIAALTSFESWDQFRQLGLDDAQTERAMRHTIDRILRPRNRGDRT